MKKVFISLFASALMFNALCAFADSDVHTETDNSVIVEDAQTPQSDVADHANPKSDDEKVSESAEPDSAKNNEETAQISVTADIADVAFMKNSTVKIAIYDSSDNLLTDGCCNITAAENHITFVFDVPKFEIGTQFKVKILDGIDSFIYYEDTYRPGDTIILPTYTYIDKNGAEAVSTNIAITINPLYDKSVNLYYNGTSTPTDGARVIDGNTMVPARALAEFMGFDVRYDEEYNVEVISLDGKDMYFNVGTAYTTVFGNDLFAPYPTVMIDDTVYISLRTFVDAAGSTLEIKDYMTHLDINISESSLISEYYSRLPINKYNVSSRTDYMVWVSLSEYKVRLYEGRMNHWKPVLEAPCAIGAPGTPTVTGSFEYNYKTRWDYGSYYVGPCLVFYRGYALHSVLLNNNGTEYDGRVGVKISHGCVRLKKKDIDFIANTIPVGTRIYITP